MCGRQLKSLLLLLCVLVTMRGSAAVVTLEDNGYKGLVVAIHKDVPENPKLVNKIKEMLTKASEQLYSSTKRRAFFEEVTIVVPPSWTSSPDYEVVQGGDRFTRAEVRVDAPNPNHGDTPYTQQPGECGEPGEYIHLTPEFLVGQLTKLEEQRGGHTEELLGDDPIEDGSLIIESYDEWPFGDTGRVFVHEWAHLRYGTFDEHGYQSDEQMPLFYADKDNMIHPTGCSNDVRGWLLDNAGLPCVLDVNGMPNSKCVFYPDIGYNSTKEDEKHSKPSMMYLPGLKEADGFCEDDDSEGRKHNSLAPNKHNIMCQGRSTWDVISNHPDFKNVNLPRNLASLMPRFRVIQPKKNQRPTFVLVLDTSGSMKGRRMELLRAATSRFIKFQLADFCMVGMVAFSGDSKLLSNMTAIDDKTREELLTRVPVKDDEGFTAIGRGIQTALKLLRDSGEPTEGTLLLLVSDGEENVEPFVNNLLSEIKESKVIINTVAFGRTASSKLENLVKITGGRGFFYDDEKVSHNMLDTAFVESAATHADIDLRPLEIVNRHLTLEGDEPKEGHFLVDKDVGRSTVFLVNYDYPVEPDKPEPLELVVWSPSGKKYSSGSPEFSSDRATLSLSVKLPLAAPGKWKYWLKNRRSDQMDLSMLVSSESSDVKEQPIRVRAWVSDLDFNFPSRVKVYAEVKKGYNPVVDATVIGTIGRPQGEPWIMMLFDNGAGADTVEGDGIYSGFFAHFNGSGRYSVEAVVVNNGQARISLGNENQHSRAPRMAVLPKEYRNRGDAAQSSFDPMELKKPTDAELLEELEEIDRRSQAMHYQSIDEFERYASAGAFRVNDFKDGDVIPPSRVTDLKIVSADLPKRKVHLKWTSPGDDMDDGQGVLTEVRYHQDPLFLLKSFNRASTSYRLLEGTQTPPMARKPHELIIEMASEVELQLNASNNRLYFAVRTRDEAGNEGDVSNLAMAHFQDPAVTARIVRGNPQHLEIVLWSIVAVVAAIVLLLAILFLVCRLKTNRKKIYECQKRQETPNNHQSDRLLQA